MDSYILIRDHFAEKNKTIIFNEGGITSMINILKSNKSARALEDAIAILRAISNSGTIIYFICY